MDRIDDLPESVQRIEGETDKEYERRLRNTKRVEAKMARLHDIQANPDKYTTGKNVRRKRNWGAKKNYRVTETVDGAEVVREYSSLAELARERNLCHDSLRHYVCGDRAGRQIKSGRYTSMHIERIGALASKQKNASSSENVTVLREE